MLCCGDLFIWASPNAGNPQKVQRYPLEWADALRRMLALYDGPTVGPRSCCPATASRSWAGTGCVQALTDTADLLESLVDQTLALMNAGARLDEVIHTVTPPGPPDGAPLPPARLRRARVRGPHRVAPLRRMVGREPGHAQAGPRAGPGRRAGRPGRRGRSPGRPGPGAPGRRWPGTGRIAADAGDPDDAALRLAGHLAELAWLAAPDDPGVQEVRRTVFTRRADAASSTMAHGVFSWAARESGGTPSGPTG